MSKYEPGRVACYLRVSTAMQTDRNGTDMQRQAVERWLKAQGLEPGGVHWFEDRAVSGAKGVTGRPEYAKLVKAAEAGEYDVIVSYDMTRLLRSIYVAAELMPMLEKQGVSLVFAGSGQVIDVADPMSRCWFTVAVAFAELERNNIRERSREGVNARINAGEKWGMGRVDYLDRSKAMTRAQRLELMHEVRHEADRNGRMKYGWVTRTAKRLGVHKDTVRAVMHRVNDEKKQEAEALLLDR